MPSAVVVVLIGLSAFQLEFDDGVPQWQALFQPLLIAVGATLPMVAARIVLGRGAAVRAAIGFVAVRGVFALIVGPGLGHVVPRFPLYLGIALCVEAGFHLARRRSTMAAVLTAGVLAGTLGVASEWGFSHLWGRMPWQAGMLPVCGSRWSVRWRPRSSAPPWRARSRVGAGWCPTAPWRLPAWPWSG